MEATAVLEAAGISRTGSTPVFRTVAVAQMVEQRIVIPPVGGSRPLGHPHLWRNGRRSGLKNRWE